MNFGQALTLLKEGKKVKRGHWTGYWVKEDDTIVMYLKTGEKMDIRDTEDVFFTLQNIVENDWEVVDNGTTTELNIQTFTFGEALRKLKQGKKVKRKGWNGKNQFLILLENNSAILYDQDENVEDVLVLHEFVAIKTVQNTLVPWLASQTDMLGEDWEVVE